jgi:tRNA uridine 5-carboxymethylaminomethyl modification enzyme
VPSPVQVERSSTTSVGSEARPPDLSSAIGQSLEQLLKRPEIVIEQLAPVLRNLTPGFFKRDSSANSAPSAVNVSEVQLSSEIRNELKSVETEIKYAGYLDQQQRAIDRLKKAEQRRIPNWFDYRAVSGLSREMQEKLGKIVPQTIGQASRIPGVTPAAVSLINVYIEIQARRREQAATL